MAAAAGTLRDQSEKCSALALELDSYRGQVAPFHSLCMMENPCVLQLDLRRESRKANTPQ